MSEDNKVVEPQTEVEVDYKAMFEKAQADLAEREAQLTAVAKKKDELLNETKQAKADRAAADAAAKQAEIEKAQKAGEFEKLWQTEAQQRKNLEEQLNGFKNQVRQEKINQAAMNIALDLASHDQNSAKLLSKFLQESVSKMAAEDGQLSPELIDSIKREVTNTKEYAPLLAGNRSTGGGAIGNGNGAALPDTMTRQEFEKLDYIQQAKAIKKYKLVD